MSRQHSWLRVGAAALALFLSGRSLLAEEPPQEEQIEIEVTESVHEVAEQAAEAAQAIAAEAAAEAQEAAAEIAAQAAEQAHRAAEEVAEKVTRAASDAAGRVTANINVTPAPYQLGLQVAPVSKALDAQLKLEGKGILIDAVEKDGPGEKAGLKPHDIVIMVAEQEIKSPAELSKTLKQSEGKELKLAVLRGGEKVTIVVQPRSTPQFSGNINLDTPKIEIEEEIIKLEAKIREKLKGAGVDVRMHVIHPGQTMPTDVLFKRADLPEGVSISVRREGGKPAQIEVSRGDEKWEVTEGELEKLPEELRPHAEHMLGRGPIGIGFPPNVKFTAPLPPGFVIAADSSVAERHRAAKAKVERASADYQLEVIVHRLDDIKKDIRRLYDQVDELREDRNKD